MACHAYISLAGDDRISHYVLNAESGKLEHKDDTAAPGGPSPLVVDWNKAFVYVGLRSGNEIGAFRIDGDSGSLEAVGTTPLDAGPCYIFVDRSNKYLLSSYYGEGKAAVHAIGDNGVIQPGAVSTQETAEHAHCIQTDRANKFAFVPHTCPPNAVYQFHFDASSGALTPNATPRAEGGEGQGPRHFEFHPTKDFVYVSNENGSTISAYRFDASAGTLSPFQTLSTIPEEFDGENNTTAQIRIHPAGKFIYVSNRGHDSIACFQIDGESGGLTAIGQQMTEPTPRVFNVDPTGQYLFAAGQGSDRVASYRIDQTTGSLQPLEVFDAGSRPMWVLFVDLS